MDTYKINKNTSLVQSVRVLYSGKFSREKTFANFMDLEKKDLNK